VSPGAERQFELVWFPGTCGRVTLIALEEVGVPVAERLLLRGWHSDPEYLSINPKGRVPTLLIDGVPFTETPAILTHLSRLYPDSHLLPSGNEGAEIDALASGSRRAYTR
jgi:glutathione S-transferase